MILTVDTSNLDDATFTDVCLTINIIGWTHTSSYCFSLYIFSVDWQFNTEDQTYSIGDDLLEFDIKPLELIPLEPPVLFQYDCTLADGGDLLDGMTFDSELNRVEVLITDTDLVGFYNFIIKATGLSSPLTDFQIQK